MKTKTINIYSFNELTESAKENAIEQIREMNYEFFWSSDYIDSAKKCLELLNCKLTNYSIDWYNINLCNWKIDVYELDKEQTIADYLQSYLPYINGDKDVTGFCADYDFFAPLREYLKNPYDIEFSELINDCVYECINAGCRDYEYNINNEGIKDYIICNDCEFTEDGELI